MTQREAANEAEALLQRVGTQKAIESQLTAVSGDFKNHDVTEADWGLASLHLALVAHSGETEKTQPASTRVVRLRAVESLAAIMFT